MKSPSPLQIEFAKDMFHLIATDTDTSKVTVIPGRCGISKTKFISALMSYFCTFDDFEYRGEEAIGMIVVTDKLDRLKEYQDEPQHIQSLWGDTKSQSNIEKYSTYIYCTSDKNSSGNSDKSAIDLLIESQYKPIVLLSTQRYFSMSDEQRDMLFDYYYVDYDKRKSKRKREILIFDEKPYFSDTLCIDVKNFNDVSTASQNGISESIKTRDDKDWLLQEYRKFRDKMETLLREKEKTNGSIDRFYWRDKNTTNLTSNDKRFFELIEKHKTTIAKEYQNAITDLKAFKSIMTDGAFFTTSKKNSYQEYKTYFELYRNNKDKFYLGKNKVKCFVFDATADIDPDYKVDYVRMIDCSKYNISLNLTINFLDVPTSKSQLVNGSNTEDQIKAIYETVKKHCYQIGFGNTLVVTYKSIIDKFKNSEFNVGYFGGIKGMNDFISSKKFAHIGNNRFKPFVYFIKLIAQNPAILEMLKNQGEAASREYINASIKINKGLFENSVMNDIMFNSILADFEQNIFRTAIRDFNNEAKVLIYIFWNCKTFTILNDMIRERYEPYGAEFEFMGVPEIVQAANTKSRKTKDGALTNPQKILRWYNNQQKGKVFKLSEMLGELSITNDDLKNAKKNKIVFTVLKNAKTDKQGYYKVI